MTMKNNSPETVAKPSQRERTRIILQYLDQACEYGYKLEKNGLISGNTDPFGIQIFQTSNAFIPYVSVNPDLIRLNLKPLGRISDEELIELTKINHFAKECFCASTGKRILDGLLDITKSIHYMNLAEQAHTLDFLRESGYALPYKNWSVKELEEFGIYKLIE